MTRLASALIAQNIFSLVSPSTTSNQILAGTETGLHYSQDCGLTWQLLTEPLGTFPAMSAACMPTVIPLILVGGIPGMVARSPDGGNTWELSRLGLPDAVVTVLAPSPAFDQDGFVLAGTAEDGIFRSGDGGRHWESANFGLLGLQVWHLSLSPAWERDHTAFAAAGDGLFRTTNGARAWKAIGQDLDSISP
ncbi:MAG: hypothetical protein IT324_32385, partial [Anaerolineae bacterium]|nr:hypothetical protein [Anaerolineae bacterium]